MSGLRADLAIVAEQIPSGSRVLDLGCGSGSLLSHLAQEKGCRGTGVEIDADQILAAIRLGVPVLELDVDRHLDNFSDNSYDVVVLSRTIQTIRRPKEVLAQMARIGQRLVVSVPNFGWYGHRLRLLAGRMPMSRELPYKWYDTPNLRFTTLVDLQLLFAELGFTVERRISLDDESRPLRLPERWANLFAAAVVYVLRPAA